MSTDGWAQLADGVRKAAAQIDRLAPQDHADGHRALLRALNNRLSRIENDGGPPELEPFNGWREKFFMDNPNYRYWIAAVADSTSYRITGNVGDSVYQSITVYAGSNVASAKAVSRVDSDAIVVAADGEFVVDVDCPQGASSIWVRYIHDGVNPANPGWCAIETRGARPVAEVPERLDRDLALLGTFIAQMPTVCDMATAAERDNPNSVRHWTAMSGGAAFTEPGVHYLRGGWQLEPGEALVIEGPVPDCRNWNILLYNRFLNSLDYRRDVVSHTGATATGHDGDYRFLLCAEDPGLPGYDWLNTQGRGFGLFVLRFLQPAAEPAHPSVRVLAYR